MHTWQVQVGGERPRPELFDCPKAAADMHVSDHHDGVSASPGIATTIRASKDCTR